MADPCRTILDLAETIRTVRAAQRQGETVVMCHGCFDIVHPGHVRHLQHAARQGDRLLVTISGDSVIDKGTGRPLIPQEYRAENLAALDCVDWVAVSSYPTAVELLETVQPDVYIKGREYERNQDPRFLEERAVVEGYGGRVIFSSGDVVFSSTALITALEASATPMHARFRELLGEENITAEDLEETILSFRNQRVLVVGEVIQDTYIMCDRPEVAGEGPIMTLRPLERRAYDGGAAIIARHLAAMGARPVLLTGLPRSTDGAAMRLRLENEGVEVHHVEIEQPIAEKQRFLVGTQKVMKLDQMHPITLDTTVGRELINRAEEAASSADAAIITDFGLGLLSSACLTELCRTLRNCVPFLAGDVSGRKSNLLAFRGVDLIAPSERELRAAVHDYEDSLNAVAQRVLHRTESRAAMVTLGADGLVILQRPPSGLQPSQERRERLTAEHVPSCVAHAVDELGCGDALLTAVTLAQSTGSSLRTAALLGTVAAATQAVRLGNQPVTAADLRRGTRQITSAHIRYEPAIPSVTVG